MLNIIWRIKKLRTLSTSGMYTFPLRFVIMIAEDEAHSLDIQVPSKLLKFAKPAFLRRTPAQNYYFFAIFFGFATKNLNGGREINFFAIVFSICVHKQNQCTQCKFPYIQMTHCRPGKTRNSSDAMCGIDLIFAIISNFALYFSIVRLQLIFFCN